MLTKLGVFWFTNGNNLLNQPSEICWRRFRRYFQHQTALWFIFEINNYTLTCRIVKFSSTLFIMYFSGRCLSLWMKLIMYSHMGLRWILYTKRPFSYLAYSVSTFSTTCLPKEHTLVEHVMVMFSLLSYLK